MPTAAQMPHITQFTPSCLDTNKLGCSYVHQDKMKCLLSLGHTIRSGTTEGIVTRGKIPIRHSALYDHAAEEVRPQASCLSIDFSCSQPAALNKKALQAYES